MVAKRPNGSSDRILKHAKQVHDQAQRFVDKHSKGINDRYQAAKTAYKLEAKKVDQVYQVLSDGLDRMMGSVSDAEINATLESLGIDPKTGNPSKSYLLSQMPNVPTHEPTSKSKASAVPAVAPTPAPAKQPKVQPTVNPNQAKIDVLQKEVQAFKAGKESLKTPTTANMADCIKHLKSVAKAIDKAYASVQGIGSEKYCDKLQDRIKVLDQEMAKLKKEYASAKAYPHLFTKKYEAAKQTYQEHQKALLADLTAFTNKVKGVCDNHVQKRNAEIAHLKTAPAPTQDNDHKSNNTPRPRGPGR